MVQSLSVSTTENIIQLIRKGYPVVFTPSGVIRHPFAHPGTLFYALDSSPLLSIRRDPRVRIESKPAAPGTNSQEVPIGPSIDSVQSEEISLSNIPVERPQMDAVQESQLHTEFTEKERQAAHRIQKCYRRYIRRKTAQPSDPLLEKLSKECLSVSQGLKCSENYRRLFRGPLPHFLVCLEGFKKALAAKKLKLSVLTLNVAHTELEDALQKLNSIKLVHLSSLTTSE